MTEHATFEDLMANADDNIKKIARALRTEILKIDPGACEIVRMGDRAATYGIGPKRMSEGYCYIMPHKAWVNLGFYHGAHLNDETGRLEGAGKKLRHVKIRSLDAVSETALSALIRQALEERRDQQ